MSGTSPEVVLGGTVLVDAVEVVTEVLVDAVEVVTEVLVDAVEVVTEVLEGAVEGGSPLSVQAPVADRAIRARTAPLVAPSRFMGPGGVRG
ncbi:MAG: hypothetical protein VX516_01010 [Actinomycetota bacterium]|nr:hypothetical protein [Actinomycetota bacterium]